MGQTLNGFEINPSGKSVENSQLEADLSHLPKGVYQVFLIHQNGELNAKISKPLLLH
jgi:hypothetical protein